MSNKLYNLLANALTDADGTREKIRVLLKEADDKDIALYVQVIFATHSFGIGEAEVMLEAIKRLDTSIGTGPPITLPPDYTVGR